MKIVLARGLIGKSLKLQNTKVRVETSAAGFQENIMMEEAEMCDPRGVTATHDLQSASDPHAPLFSSMGRISISDYLTLLTILLWQYAFACEIVGKNDPI